MLLVGSVFGVIFLLLIVVDCSVFITLDVLVFGELLLRFFDNCVIVHIPSASAKLAPRQINNIHNFLNLEK